MRDSYVPRGWHCVIADAVAVSLVHGYAVAEASLATNGNQSATRRNITTTDQLLQSLEQSFHNMDNILIPLWLSTNKMSIAGVNNRWTHSFVIALSSVQCSSH